MFERFTNQSRRVVVLAQEEARLLNHNYIGTEHLLLGLLHEGRGAAGRTLAAADVTLEAAQREVEAIIGRGKESPSGHIPFTPRAKKCLELSLREALQLGHSYIGTGHILLGVIKEGDGVAIKILGRLGADPVLLRARVTVEMEEHPEDEQGLGEPAAVRVRPRDDPIRGLLETISNRLSSIERYLGITGGVPDELRGYDKRLLRIRREKEAAIDRQDFAAAAELRDKEKELRSERERAVKGFAAGAARRAGAGDRGDETPEAAASTVAGPEVAGPEGVAGPAESAGAAQMQAEITRLRALLREHDIDPGGPGDPRAAAG